MKKMTSAEKTKKKKTKKKQNMSPANVLMNVYIMAWKRQLHDLIVEPVNDC